MSLRVELFHDVNEVVVKLHQSRNHWLDFPPTELPERYLRNQLAVSLQLECEFGGHYARYSALLTQSHIAGDLYGNDGDFPRACSHTQHQFSVFVDDIHFVKDENGIIDRIGGIVWLKPLDQVAHYSISDSLYFSFVQGDTISIDWPSFKNWEFDSPKMIPPVSLRRKLPDDMIQARAQVVHNFTSKHAEPGRDDTALVVLNSLQEQLFVVLWDDGVFALLKKDTNLGLKVQDVLVCPF